MPIPRRDLDVALSPIDDEPPPPAYSEQEFDQKTIQAIQASLTERDRATGQNGNEREREQWDEGAAVQRSAAASGSSPAAPSSTSSHFAPSHYTSSHLLGDSKRHPLAPPTIAIEPLRIHKKSSIQHHESVVIGADQTGTPWQDAMPSQRAEEDENRPRQHYTSGTPHVPSHPAQLQDIPPEPGDPNNRPPPSFTPIGPSLDGPPYDRVVDGASFSSSRAIQSLPVYADHSFSQEYRIREAHVPDSFPIPPRPQLLRPQTRRPVISYTASSKVLQTTSGPILEFDPSMAYSNSTNHFTTQATNKTSPVTPQSTSFTANAFYKSSISAYLTPSASQKTPQYETTGSQQQSSPVSDFPFTRNLSNQSSQSVARQDQTFVSGRLRTHSASSSLSSPTASHFPRYPSHADPRASLALPRWATSEEQYSENNQ